MIGNSGKVAEAAEKAVLERVADALENALEGFTIELIMTEEKGRMHRITGPGLKEAVYVHVQASAFGALTASKVLEGK